MIHCAKTVDDFGEGPEVFWFVSLDGEAWLGVDREPKPDMREAIADLFGPQQDWITGHGMVETRYITLTTHWLRHHGADFWRLGE